MVELRRSRASSALPFDTLPVTEGPLQARVTANGTLSALVTVQVGTQVSGRIQTLNVDFNSPVKKGQIIAQIDPLLFRAAVEQARANYAAANGNLVKARAQAVDAHRQYVREEQLFKDKLVAEADRDTAEANDRADAAQVVADEGALAQARAALEQAQINLDYTHIISPIDGVVISRNVDVGQTVAAAFQAPVLFLIAQDLRAMQVDTSVAEADVGRLADRMAASFTVDAYPSDVFKGTIRQVRKNPQTVQNVVTYDAVIDVRNDDFKLFPGMTANVTVIYADEAKVLRVPNAALRYRPPADLAIHAPRAPAGQRVVWVVDGEQPRPVLIRIGVSDGTLTEVVEGPLRAGDRVVTENLASTAAGRQGGFGRVL
ncbi:MAG TPA: efflux RND transporter periplasmic adaptor subunit [Myxococcales bacterium]|nr:efflux RND transporter periplasmic adaptor subunit [Myxococcales bacterium]